MIREHRLRLRAELQSLISELKHLRQREADHIKSASGIPQFTTEKIREAREKIARLEDELQEGESPPAQRLYREAFAAELTGDFKKAMRLYKQAARQKYPDARAALRSVRHRAGPDRTRQLAALGVPAAIILAAILIISFVGRQPADDNVNPEPALSFVPASPTAAIPTPTPPPPPPTNTPRPTVASTPTPLPPTGAPPAAASATAGTEPRPEPSPPPTETPFLRAAPKIIGPHDDLVWQGGTIVFEFEDMDLAGDELYCLDTLRGFDKSGTENWSYPMTGSKTPSIPIDANAFSVAKTLGMQCVTWQAYIGQRDCDARISELTPLRVIGLPNPCNFD